MKLTATTFAALAAMAAWAAPALAQEGGRPMQITMTGAAEAPNPGDPDGSGTAMLRINPGQMQVCYELKVTGINPATAAHIHEGAPGQPGGVVVPLTAPTNGSSSGCAQVSRELAQNLIQNPGRYYVNVHTADFPAGALRGQLSK